MNPEAVGYLQLIAVVVLFAIVMLFRPARDTFAM